ncbi:MAG: RNA polymerase sigma factor [Candidatus Limnocylindria bacterium]
MGADGTFEAAILEQTPDLLAAARVMTMDEAEAEDLVQWTIETALRKGDQLRDPGALRPWLFRIQGREAVRLRRRMQAFVRWDAEWPEPIAPVEDRADFLAVREAIGSLPRRTRAALVLHYMIGLSVGDTASALGTSANTVKTQLRHGLARVREELKDA